MTTIAFKDGIMAADGRETLTENGKADGYVITDKCKKIVRLPDGSLFAGRGVSEDIARVLDALLVGKKKLPKSDDCTCLMVKPDGTVLLYEGRKFRPIEPAMKYYAIGSGARYAFCAMDVGATAEKAVAVAAERDVWSGGKVQVVPLRPVEPDKEEKS